MKRLISPPLPRSQSSRPAIVFIAAVSTVLLGVVLLLHSWKGVPIGVLTRDPVAVMEGHVYTGFLSQIGIFFWAASAAVCLFCANILAKPTDDLEMRRFLFSSGLLTLVLGLDDVFLLHEGVFPSLGIPEMAVYASYAAFVLLYLFRFYSTILKTEYILLGMAFAFFAASMGLDFLDPSGIDPHFFEDGTKLVGIVAWLVYFFRLGTVAVWDRIAERSTADRGLPEP
jgi:preprotein translocase subunit SecG